MYKENDMAQTILVTTVDKALNPARTINGKVFTTEKVPAIVITDVKEVTSTTTITLEQIEANIAGIQKEIANAQERLAYQESLKAQIEKGEGI
jgi:hypothetical protein